MKPSVCASGSGALMHLPEHDRRLQDAAAEFRVEASARAGASRQLSAVKMHMTMRQKASKTILAACVVLFAPANASSFKSTLEIYRTGVDTQAAESTANRRLLVDSTVCGFDEYFCGDTDMVADTAYNAVVAGDCFNDTSDTGSSVCKAQTTPTANRETAPVRVNFRELLLWR